MGQYGNYKKLDLEWLHEVPLQWDVKKLKYCLKAVEGGGTPSTNNPEYWNGLIPWVSPKDMKSEIIDSSEDYITELAVQQSSTKLIQPNQVLVVVRSGILKHSLPVAVNKIPVALNQDMKALTTNEDIIINDYLFWFLKGVSKEILTSCKKIGATVDSIEGKEFLNFPQVVPSIEEQYAIIRFLDHKTRQIDLAISKLQRLIELLREERAAVINEAVTKGINPGVPMKDSGIEWIGEIPKHWEVMKLKYVASLKSGNGITSESIKEQGEYPVYGGNGLRGYYSSYTHEGDFVLIGRQGALCGNINYASGKFWASEHAVVVTVFNEENYRWLGELLRVMDLNKYSVSAAQPGISVDRIQNLFIPVPSIDEQNQIAFYIGQEELRIQNAMYSIHEEITLLQEYRQSLISEAVTGKIDVRDYAIPEEEN